MISVGRLGPAVSADREDGALLALPATWSEVTFDRGPFGPNDRDGIHARVELDTMALSVVPVRYRCQDGVERLRGIATALDRTRRERTAVLPDVAPMTAFATVCSYRPFGTDETAVVCIAADAGDALAAAVWLAGSAGTDRGLRRAIRAHRGRRPPGASGVAVSDDDALGAHFVDTPERCPFTGRPTSSHSLHLPYRYVPVLSGCPRSDAGTIRFPSTVDALVGAVSHTAWEDRDLVAVDSRAPVDRLGPGRYALDEAVAAAVAGGSSAAFAHTRPGSGSLRE